MSGIFSHGGKRAKYCNPCLQILYRNGTTTKFRPWGKRASGAGL